MARLQKHSVLIATACALLLAQDAESSGVLVPRDGSAPIAIRSHRVSARIEDGIARTQVRQVFVNPHARPLEAIYAFPLPEDASIVELSMTVANQRLEGLLVERREARRVYDLLTGRKKDPALLEQIGRTDYRLSVFPVMPQVETVIELTYVEPVPLVAGEMRYVYPLASTGTATATQHDLTATIEFASSARISALTSPTPGMATTLLSAREGRGSFEQSAAKLDTDLVVVAHVVTEEPTLRVHTYRATGGDAFFAAVLTAPRLDDEAVIPRDFTFVLDVSGSMSGEKLAQAKRAAAWWIDRLGPRDRANLVLFSDSVKSFADSPVDATAENRRALSEFLAAAKESGGTDLHAAVSAAGRHRASVERLAVSVLLTDGRPTIGETSPSVILNRAREAGDAGVSIHAFGIGNDVDPTLLDGIASSARGSSEVLRSVGDVEERLRSFLTRIGAPALRGKAIRIGEHTIDDTIPRAPFTVFSGEQFVVVGRCAQFGALPIAFDTVFGDSTLELRAMADFGQPDRSTASGSIVARDLYAEHRIEFLERAHRLRLGLDDAAYHAAIDAGRYDTADELVAAMIDVSLETGVQCAYTSFLALLPEDRANLHRNDPVALDAALKRAAERRRILAASADDASSGEARGDDDGSVAQAEVEPTEELVGAELELAASPFDGRGDNDVIGVGGASGGRFGGKYGKRGGGKGGGRATQSAVDLGLDWMKRHQDLEGNWSASGFGKRCEKDACDGAGDLALDVRVTSLALLSYLGAGNTPNTGKYESTVTKSVKWLVDRQDATTGLFLPESTHEDALVDHALATLAICEAYGLSRWPTLQPPAERGLAALLARRVPGAGWRRTGVDSGDCDLATTTHALLAFLSARDFGLAPDPAAMQEIHEWLKARSTPSEPLDAARILFARLLLGDDSSDPSLRALADPIHTAVDSRGVAGSPSDPEFLYFAAYAMYQMGFDDWDRMQKRLPDLVVKAQLPTGDEKGSWNPAPPRAGERDGGRVAATALSTLCLEVYYRYDRVLGVR